MLEQLNVSLRRGIMRDCFDNIILCVRVPRVIAYNNCTAQSISHNKSTIRAARILDISFPSYTNDRHVAYTVLPKICRYPPVPRTPESSLSRKKSKKLAHGIRALLAGESAM